MDNHVRDPVTGSQANGHKNTKYNQRSQASGHIKEHETFRNHRS